MLLDEDVEKLRQAAREHWLVSVAYNRGRSVLAPYATYKQGGEDYLRAITVARDGREPKRLKLGIFKLAGLTELQVTQIPFPAVSLLRRTEANRS